MPHGFDGFFGGIGMLGLLWFAISVAFTVAIVILIVVAIRWLVRNTAAADHPGHASGGPTEDSALATLRERFARGEIDAEEYEARRRTLGV
jgi:putative membrane protein